MRIFRLFFLFAVLTGFTKTAEQSGRFKELSGPLPIKAWHINGYAQGTTYHITYYARTNPVGQLQTDSLLNSIDSSLSIYKSYSLISRFNEASRGVFLDKHLKAVVERSLEIGKDTDGLFDITVQPLVEAWGFGVQHPRKLPDSARIKTLLSYVGTDKIAMRGDSLLKSNPRVCIDVNGIAQGYTADVLAAYLEKNGIRNYLAEIGGEMRLKGRRKPGNKKMAIGIEAPSGDAPLPSVIRRIITPGRGAVTTSGNYRKYYESGTKKISHLIDPRTGYSFQNELISVTVWAKDGITADGYDNPLMGMGLQKALEFVKARKYLEAYFIFHRPDGSIGDTATQGFLKIMQPN